MSGPLSGFNLPGSPDANGIYLAADGTVFIASEIHSTDAANGTYAHELSNLIAGELTNNEDFFGIPADPKDHDTGHAVEVQMFGHAIKGW